MVFRISLAQAARSFQGCQEWSLSRSPGAKRSKSVASSSMTACNVCVVIFVEQCQRFRRTQALLLDVRLECFYHGLGWASFRTISTTEPYLPCSQRTIVSERAPCVLYRQSCHMVLGLPRRIFQHDATLSGRPVFLLGGMSAIGLVDQEKDEIGKHHVGTPLCTDWLCVHHRTRSENAMVRRRSRRVDASVLRKGIPLRSGG